MSAKDRERPQYSGQDLSGQDFSGRDLHDADFRDATLRKTGLQGANLSGADFSGADLRDADLDGVSAYGAKFVKARLAGARARRATLSYADFTDADLAGADLEGAEFEETVGRNADFSEANLRRCFFSGGDYVASTLRRADLAEARMYRCDFSGADFSDASLIGARVSGMRLDGAVFRRTRLPDGSVHEPEGAAAAADAIAEQLARAMGEVQAAQTPYRAQADETSGHALQLAWEGLVDHDGFRLLPDAARAEMLVTAGRDFLAGYQSGGAASELARTCPFWRRALLTTQREPEQRKQGLESLGDALLDACRETGRIGDVDVVVEWYLRTLEESALDATVQVDLLYGLGNRLRRTHGEAHAPGPLNLAVLCHRSALERAGPDLPIVPDLHDTLAVDLRIRYEVTGDAADLQDAVTAWRRATELAAARPGVSPEYRADYMFNLACGLRLRFERLGAPADVDEAISRFGDVLESAPARWPSAARALEYLADTLYLRYRRTNDAADLDRVVELRRRLIAAHGAGAPEQRDEAPRWLHDLASALMVRFGIRGDQADCVAAIEAWRRALKLDSGSLGVKGLILVEMMKTAPTELSELRPTEVPAVAELARTIQAALAEAVRAGDERQAQTLRLGLGGLLTAFRPVAGAPDDPAQDGIGPLEEALRAPSGLEPEELAVAHDMLSRAYRERTRGSKAQNIEDAVRHGTAALEHVSREKAQALWGGVQTNLAAAYLERIHGERAENVELAIGHLEGALQVRRQDRFPVQWAMLQNSLGLAYLLRVRGDRADNLEKAIAYLDNALEVRNSRDFPGKWADTHSQLANAYLERSLGDRAENVERAIAHTSSALEVRTRDAFPIQWAEAQLRLGAAHQLRAHGDPVGNLRTALASAENALAVLQRDSSPRLWGMAHQNAAEALVRLRTSVGEEAAERALAHYRHALEALTLDVFPADHLMTQRRLGELLLELKRWEPAHDALQAAIAASDALYAEAFTEVGRRSEVARAGDLWGTDAWCLMRLGKPSPALERLEKGRARLLAEALALRELDLRVLPVEQREVMRDLRQAIRALEAEMRLPPATPARRDDRSLAQALEQARTRLSGTIRTVRESRPDFMPEALEAAGILSVIPEEAALVAPMVTAHGSAILVVPGGAQSVSDGHVVWVDHFQEADLRDLLVGPAGQARTGGWLGAYFNARADAGTWLDTIEAVTGALWEQIMGPAAERLRRLGVRKVLLMPRGRLGLLPLHAAWREVEGERQYFLDDFVVCYLPSAQARRASLSRLPEARRRQRSLLAVVDPTLDLPFAPAEGQRVARLFGPAQSTILRGSGATPDAVTRGAAGYLHFACHGFYDWRDAMQSGLVLAGRETLTVGQVIGQLGLEGTRLVALSACETGITDIGQLPDEYLGLPAGFMQAGAPAVLSTLWAVNDLSTMLLMERFYQLHLQLGRELPDALCHAQGWLRGVTSGDLARRFRDEKAAALRGEAGTPSDLVSEYGERFASQDPDHRPFEHPFHWAAFTLSGA